MSADQRPVQPEDIGRSCPYCRFPVKEGSVVACPSCDALHHAECWSDNAGCAVLGCVGGAATSTPAAAGVTAQASQVPQPGGGPLSPYPPAPAAHPGPGASARAGVSRGLVAALVLLAVAVAGGGVAVALSQQGRGQTVVVTRAAAASSQTRTDTAQNDPDTVSSGSRTPSSASDTEHVSDGSDSSASSTGTSDADPADVEDVLRRYYGAVSRGDFNQAWSLLSPSYKAWKQQPTNGGRAKWTVQEERNRKWLDPSGLSVTIDSFDTSTGVATINVQGMTFTQEGRAPCDYVGITWARRISGRWYYDQGYGQNAARLAKWRPRRNETLGVPCENDAY